MVSKHPEEPGSEYVQLYAQGGPRLLKAQQNPTICSSRLTELLWNKIGALEASDRGRSAKIPRIQSSAASLYGGVSRQCQGEFPPLRLSTHDDSLRWSRTSN